MRQKFLNVPVTHRKTIYKYEKNILNNSFHFRQWKNIQINHVSKKTFSLTYTENGHVCNNNNNNYTKYNKQMGCICIHMR